MKTFNKGNRLKTLKMKTWALGLEASVLWPPYQRQSIYRFNATPFKIPVMLFANIGQVLKRMRKPKRSWSQGRGEQRLLTRHFCLQGVRSTLSRAPYLAVVHLRPHHPFHVFFVHGRRHPKTVAHTQDFCLPVWIGHFHGTVENHWPGIQLSRKWDTAEYSMSSPGLNATVVPN